jgi:adenylate cyclase
MSINDQLERILNTPPLVSSPSLSRFLRYIVEETAAGRAAAIKEYTLGLNVFDRGDEFNPRLDPIVRVQARNLRARLERYYLTQGVNDPIRIELPKGTYVPIFHFRSPETVSETAQPATAGAAGMSASAAISVMPAPPPRSPVDERRGHPRFLLAALILAVLLVGIAAFWAGQTQAERAKSRHGDPEARLLHAVARPVPPALPRMQTGMLRG